MCLLHLVLRDEIENLFHQISNFEMGTRYKKKYVVVEREISLLNLTRFFEIEKSRHALIGSGAVTFLIYTGVVFRIDWGSGWFFCNREKYGLWQTTIRLNLDERLELSPFFRGVCIYLKLAILLREQGGTIGGTFVEPNYGLINIFFVLGC